MHTVSEMHCIFSTLSLNIFSFAISLTVLPNIALGKPAVQSSTYLSYGAECAVDGNRGTDLIVDKCASTDTGDTNPWWGVDLQTVYSITSVRILNRGLDKYAIGKQTNNNVAKPNYNIWREDCLILFYRSIVFF